MVRGVTFHMKIRGEYFSTFKLPDSMNKIHTYIYICKVTLSMYTQSSHMIKNSNSAWNYDEYWYCTQKGPYQWNMDSLGGERWRTSCSPDSWLSWALVLMEVSNGPFGSTGLSGRCTGHERVWRLGLSPRSCLVHCFPPSWRLDWLLDELGEKQVTSCNGFKLIWPRSIFTSVVTVVWLWYFFCFNC